MWNPKKIKHTRLIPLVIVYSMKKRHSSIPYPSHSERMKGKIDNIAWIESTHTHTHT